MVRREILVQLTDELRQALDEEAALRGVSRSAIIREAAAQYLASAQQRSVGRRIVDGYRRIPQGTADEWGDLEKQVEVATEESLHRLDAEERAQSIPPW